jgi:hypothetical protein
MQTKWKWKIMASKENFKLVSQFKKNVSILCPLITSTLLVCCKKCYMVAAHSIAKCRKYTRVQGPCFNKVKPFSLSVQNVFQAVKLSVGSKSLSVDASVYPSGVGSNCLHSRYHSTMSSCHGFCAIITDTNTSWPPKSIWCHKAVQYFKKYPLLLSWFSIVYRRGCLP